MTAATDAAGFILLLLASALVAGRIVVGFWRLRQDRAWRRRQADWDRDIAEQEQKRQERAQQGQEETQS